MFEFDEKNMMEKKEKKKKEEDQPQVFLLDYKYIVLYCLFLLLIRWSIQSKSGITMETQRDCILDICCLRGKWRASAHN